MKSFQYILCCLLILSCSSGGGDETPPQPNPDPDSGTENNPPSTPSLSFPSKDLLCTQSELTFEWGKANDPDGDTINYQLQISTNRSFTALVEDHMVSTNSKTLVMEAGQDYYWRVLAIDSKNTKSQFTPSWAFYVEGEATTNYVPYIPSLISPLSGIEVRSGLVTLEWEGSDIDNDPLKFDLYLGTTNPPVLFETDLSQSSIEVTVEINREYYWKVHVKDDISTSYGGIWTFTVLE